MRVFEDGELDRLIDDFVAAAKLARAAGFSFVDVKACHGYLGHELLGARTRSGPYGGPLENRTRFMRRVIEAIQANVSGLAIAVRLSVFDTIPYRKRASDQVGEPEREAESLAADPESLPGFGALNDDDALDAALDGRGACCGCWSRPASRGFASRPAARRPAIQRRAVSAAQECDLQKIAARRWRRSGDGAPEARFSRLVFVGSA